MKKYLEWLVIVLCVFILYRLVTDTWPHWQSMWNDVEYNLNKALIMLGGG